MSGCEMCVSLSLCVLRLLGWGIDFHDGVRGFIFPPPLSWLVSVCFTFHLLFFIVFISH